MPLDNSHYAVSDIAARDLISSYFRFPWELTLMDFRAFAQVPPTFGCPSRLPSWLLPPGGAFRGYAAQPMVGQLPDFQLIT
jgi:hypothetical protein